MALSILLVDDNNSFRTALSRFLETVAGVNVVAETYQGFDVLTKDELAAPDLMLLDIVLAPLRCLELARRAQASVKPPRIVFLSKHNLDDYRETVKDIIGAEFIEKEDAVCTLIPLIERMVVARLERSTFSELN
jgi:DNA-binding NarL/FixJ family response regulator